MTRLNHSRPELRNKDNFRRELAKIVAINHLAPADSQWPSFMRPVAANPKALQYLFDWFSALSNWIEGDDMQFSSHHWPSEVEEAFDKFASCRVPSPYDVERTGREWLEEPFGNSHRERDDFRPFLLSIFRAQK